MEVKMFLNRLALAALLIAVAVAPAGETPRTPASLADQAQALAARRLEELGEGYEARVDDTRHILYVHALDETTFQQAAGLLSLLTDEFRRNVHDVELPWNVTILLPTADRYKTMAAEQKLPPTARGFYQPPQRTLVSIDHGRVLLHEFTHALHHAALARGAKAPPAWLAEGLATLFEGSDVADGKLRPVIDIRLLALNKQIKGGTLPSLEKLAGLSYEQFQKAGAPAYAHARYVSLYLYQQGKLPAFFAASLKAGDDDPTCLAALESTVGSIERFERDWRKWAEGLKLPVAEKAAHKASLGLEFRQAEAGVEVAAVVEGSAAAVAGRIEKGDIIKSFNGRKISNTLELSAAIRAAGAKQTVTVELVRRGQSLTVQQPLASAGD